MTVTAIEIPTALVVQQARDALRPLAELVHAKRFDDVRLRAECDGDTVDVTVPRAACCSRVSLSYRMATRSLSCRCALNSRHNRRRRS